MVVVSSQTICTLCLYTDCWTLRAIASELYTCHTVTVNDADMVCRQPRYMPKCFRVVTKCSRYTCNTRYIGVAISSW